MLFKAFDENGIEPSSGDQPDCNGHSTVFDGIAWFRDEPWVRDMCIFEAPEEEGIYIAEIDMDLLRDYREHEVMGRNIVIRRNTGQ